MIDLERTIELPTVTAESELIRFLGKIEEHSGQYVFSPFRLLRFRQRLKNCDVFSMFCQPLQQTTYMYLVSIDKFWALTGRRKEASFIARFGENRCKICRIVAASSKQSADVSDLSPKKKPAKCIRYEKYRYEYGKEFHKKLQFF